MDKQKDEAFEKWRVVNKSLTRQAYDAAFAAGRAAARQEALDAVEAVRVSLRQHGLTGIEVSRSAKYEHACDEIARRIREGGKGE